MKDRKKTLSFTIILFSFLILISTFMYNREIKRSKDEIVNSKASGKDEINKDNVGRLNPKIGHDNFLDRDYLYVENSSDYTMIDYHYDIFEGNKRIEKRDILSSIRPRSTSRRYYIDGKNKLYKLDSIRLLDNVENSVFLLKKGKGNDFNLKKLGYLDKGPLVVRTLVPKMEIVKKKNEYLLESYIYNLTNYDILSYGLVYEDFDNNTSYQLAFNDEIKSKAKSEKILSKGPSSGRYEDINQVQAVMVLRDKEGKIYKYEYDILLDLIFKLNDDGSILYLPEKRDYE